jgi:hypothetical protein
MLTEPTIHAFADLCASRRVEWLEDVERRVREVYLMFQQSGTAFSSAFPQSARTVVVQAYRERAGAIYALLVDVEASEAAASNINERNDQLKSLLRAELKESFDRCQAVFTERTKQVTDRYPVTIEPMTSELDRAERQYSSQIFLTVAQRARNPASTMSFNFHASVGAVQTGAGSTANVTQNVGVPEDRKAVLAALSVVAAALQAATNLGESIRAQGLQTVDSLVTEVGKEQLNAISVGGLVDALGFVIEAVPNAASAWSTVTEWVAPLKAAIGL